MAAEGGATIAGTMADADLPVAGLEDVALKAAALPEVGLKASAGVQAGSTGTLAADSMVAMAVASTVVGAAASTVAVADTAKPVARSTGFYRKIGSDAKNQRLAANVASRFVCCGSPSASLGTARCC